MKRPIGFELGVKSDGTSDFQCGKNGENARAKKVRVSGCRPLLQAQLDVPVEFEGQEKDGTENRLMDIEQPGFLDGVFDTIDDGKLTSSEEAYMGIHGQQENEGIEIENGIMGVEELGFVAGRYRRILSGKEVSPSVDKDENGAGGKENNEVGSEEVGLEVQVTEIKRIENQLLGSGIEDNRVLNGALRCENGNTEEEENEKTDHLKRLEKITPSSGRGSFMKTGELILTVDDPIEGGKWDFDLNFPVAEAEGGTEGGTEISSQEFTQLGPVIAERRMEIIDISSDESEDEGKKLVIARHARGKTKEIEKEFACESILGFGLDFGTKVTGQPADGSSSQCGGTRYTTEEKGKAKLAYSCSSLTTNPRQLDLKPERLEQIKSLTLGNIQLYEASQSRETTQLQGTDKLGFQKEQAILSVRGAQLQRQRENAARYSEILSRHAHRLANFKPQWEDYCLESFKQERTMPSTQSDRTSEDLLIPFSTALRIIRDQNAKRNAQQMIEWKPSGYPDINIPTRLVPSLLDLCLKVLAMNAEAIVSLETVPDGLKRRFTNLLCDLRRMDSHTLDLLVRGLPTEIRVKDSSWITEEQFTKTFSSFDAKNLRVLQLDLCGQCVLDDILGKTLARSSNSLPGLGIISLRGACRLSDITLKALVASAPALCSINLGQCSLLTHAGINILASSLGSILRELYIGDCQRIDAMLIVPALKKFEHLEVLSVAGIQTVCDDFVIYIVTARGQNIKELDLADCLKLTNISLTVIGNNCSQLRSLNISNLQKLTDVGIQYLADGCRSIQTLKLCRNMFSDEAIAAFLEVSGKCLKELSLNNVSKVGPITALSLSKCSKKLLSLDLSWCRRITNEALGLIVDSCTSLKLLKLFGCTQITDVFLNGHSNALVQIIGLNLTPVLEHLHILEPEEFLLSYSPLPFCSDSLTVDHQDV